MVGSFYETTKDFWGCGTHPPERFRKNSYNPSKSSCRMGRYYPSCAQRVDLLGWISEENWNSRTTSMHSYWESSARKATTVLLGRVHSSLVLLTTKSTAWQCFYYLLKCFLRISAISLIESSLRLIKNFSSNSELSVIFTNAPKLSQK